MNKENCALKLVDEIILPEEGFNYNLQCTVPLFGNYFKFVLTYAIIFIIFYYTNLYCAETLNIVLSFVIDVHFVMVLLLVFPQM